MTEPLRCVVWKTLLPLVLLALVSAGGPARADLRIEITQGIDAALPIAVVPFAQPWRAAGSATQLDTVISADLARSGRFRLTDTGLMVDRPNSGKDIDYRDWRLVGADSVVIGRVEEAGLGQYHIEYELHDAVRGERLLGRQFKGIAQADLQRLGHFIADQIFEALMGYRGVFSTRIAYITDAEGTYELQVADADGQNPLGVLSAQEPIISPAWSPDGSELAYVSFENGRPGIYIQELATGRRERVVGFPGINGAPAWSPDGQRLAVTLSKDGDPEIYIYERASGGLHRITNHYAIDTEAAWAPDGRSLLFTSDRSGGPQIYQVPTSGGTPRRITFDAGNYNARASFSPDGGSVTFVTRSDRGYHIAVLELASGKHRVLTDGRLDESPSFAPNGKSIIYTTTQSGREMLATVSVDGRIRQQLAVEQVRVREPAWSPFLN